MSLEESVAILNRGRGLRCILCCSIASRILILFLMIIWRSLLASYDTSASINPPCLSADTYAEDSPTSDVLFPKLGSAIERSIVWDGVYFVRVAECGYEYEQDYAFLPLLPSCISILSKTVFAPLVPVVGFRAVLGFSGYILNNLAFVLSALYLYRLSLAVMKDQRISLRASILFCFNPASIFYSSIYSESVYALTSFGGLYYIMTGSDCSAAFLFALSSCARSNGFLNAGYICYRKLIDALLYRKGAYLRILKNLLVAALFSLVIATPFISFQVFGYSNICKGCSLTETRAWCKARLPLMYKYIQEQYWGVGFLRYFQVKQIPNFLLALPSLSLSLCSIVHYMKLWPELIQSIGLLSFSQKNILTSSSSSTTSMNQSNPVSFSQKNSVPVSQRLRRNRPNRRAIMGEAYLNENPSVFNKANTAQPSPMVILPFILHLMFLSATAFFVMHVQVTTRFLSSSPVLYWYASQVMEYGGSRRRWGYVIWAYSAFYILIGTLLFSNFYPFT